VTATMRSVMCCCVAFGIALAGCKDEQAEHSHDASAHADAAEFEGCPQETPRFEPGMTTLSAEGRIAVVLQDASGIPPVRYFNDWTLAFTDAEGAPLEDLEVLRARAYMRVHNHYGTPDPRVVRQDDDPSVFELERINLFMRGPWEVQLTLRSESAGEDDVVVHVCVEE
jgi:hypothetical protein